MAALLCPPAGHVPHEERVLLEPLARARRSFAAQSRARRELTYFGLALLAGLLMVPVLTWFVGSQVLGPYSRGTEVHNNAFALLKDFYLGLSHGYLTFWLVALGPAVFLLLIRIFLAIVRRQVKEAPNGG
jgi:hypothetical protein